jgi:hypothetical protein
MSTLKGFAVGDAGCNVRGGVAFAAFGPAQSAGLDAIDCDVTTPPNAVAARRAQRP